MPPKKVTTRATKQVAPQNEPQASQGQICSKKRRHDDSQESPSPPRRTKRKTSEQEPEALQNLVSPLTPILNSRPKSRAIRVTRQRREYGSLIISEGDPSDLSDSDKSDDNGSTRKLEVVPKAKREIRRKVANGLTLELPPISSITHMFQDMVKRAHDKLNFGKAISHFGGRPIRVATMCSGTESPLLALQMISEALQTLFAMNLQIDHRFSAEIVAFKQAFIERNFRPIILFRDIKELSQGDEATTAYGQRVKIPRNVDLLIAGFSCVDFSNLNRKKKELDEGGESGDTFEAICRYIVRYRPALCILENIMGAPWEEIEHLFRNDVGWLNARKGKTAVKALWDEGAPGYAAKHIPVDTKKYYIPQTRKRGYIILIDRKHPNADGAVLAWQAAMLKLERPASSPFEDFFLDDADIHLSRAKVDLTNGQAHETDWNRCKIRYRDYRDAKQLGHQRPLTQWRDGGSFRAPDHWWKGWLKTQVERIYDTLDINYLYNAALKSTDNRYKSRMIEVSQNVDRAEDTNRPGIISCLTPTGTQFISNKGRPLTGHEALALQGLPLHKLLLTRETQKEQLDMAGNAMTTTVVGAAIISAFIAAYEAIDFGDRTAQLPVEAPTLTEMDCSALGNRHELDLSCQDAFIHGQPAVEVLKQAAKQSARLCECEGQYQHTGHEILICKDCHHTSCQACAGIPEHDYTEMRLHSRMDPVSFTDFLRHVLPMRLQLIGIDSNVLEPLKAKYSAIISHGDWEIFENAILLISREEYRFYAAMRSRHWTVKYESSRSYLELIIYEDSMHWQIYGKPPLEAPANSRVREMLKYPLARLELQIGKDILEGRWALNLPAIRNFSLKIQGVEDLYGLDGTIPSWEAELGIESDKLKNKRVFRMLKIEIDGEIPFGDHDSLANKISGSYKLSPQCGTSFRSMHKRISPESSDYRPIYFWLDAEQIGEPGDDRFGFSHHSYHVGTKLQRHYLASIQPSWRPSLDQPQKIGSEAYGLYVGCEAVLQAFNVSDSAPVYIEILEAESSISVNQDTSQGSTSECLSSINALLHVAVPLTSEDKWWGNGSRSQPIQIDEPQALTSLAWLTERARHLNQFPATWRPLDLLGPKDPSMAPTPCQACSPKAPSFKWALKTVSIGRRKDREEISPIEDSQQAGVFERAIKARKQPFVIYKWVEQDSPSGNKTLKNDRRSCGHLMIGINVVTLAHRVLASFKDVNDSTQIELSWRLDTNYKWPQSISFPKFLLKNNKDTPQANFSFSHGKSSPQLREEQLRSLTWMIDQELKPSKFQEQETVEKHLQEFSWLAQVIGKKPCFGRGGLLADEVGFGKTATTLALIDYTKAEAAESSKVPRQSAISLKATLIIVPGTIVNQWETQIRKFLGKKYNILIIKDMTVYKRFSIKRFQEADIVLVSSGIFKSPVYVKRVAEFASIRECGTHAKRPYKIWLDEVIERVTDNMEDLLTRQEDGRKISKFLDVLEAKFNSFENEMVGEQPKRLRGATYVNAAKQPKPKAIKAPTKIPDSFGFKSSSSIGDIKGPILQMFHFHRVIVDEYTYTEDVEKSFIAAIPSNNRWVLSGTPRLDDFLDVKTVAHFLGINLGVDDEGAMALKLRNFNRLRNYRTQLQQFVAAAEEHTPAWHLSRHEHAQNFLDHFARQNKPNIDRIETEEYIRPVRISGVERAIYLELREQIDERELAVPHISDKYTIGDRNRRLRAILSDCNSPEEALIKRCSHLVPETLNSKLASTVTEWYNLFQSKRRVDYLELVSELLETFRMTEWIQKRYISLGMGKDEISHYAKWKKGLKKLASEDPVGASRLRRIIRVAQQTRFTDREDHFYLSVEEQNLVKKAKKARTAKKPANPKKGEESEESEGAKENEENEENEESGESEEGEESEESEEGEEDDEGDEGEESDKDAPIRKQRTKISLEDSKIVGLELRELVNIIRVCQEELFSRIKICRFSEAICTIHNWLSEVGVPLSCENCGSEVVHPATTFVLGLCGHIVCYNCLYDEERPLNETYNDNGDDNHCKCPVRYCNTAAKKSHIHPATMFQSRSTKTLSSRKESEEFHYGAKISAVVNLIRNQIPANDRVLLFVQYSDLMRHVTEAFKKYKISFLAVFDSSMDKSVKAMEDFLEDKSKSKAKVLILNPTSAAAAGANITMVNHVVFFSPIFSDNVDEYHQSMVQCIGRAVRWGQEKKVHVHHMVALRTIEADIFQGRKGKHLVRRFVGGQEVMELKKLEELTPDESPTMYGGLPEESELDPTKAPARRTHIPRIEEIVEGSSLDEKFIVADRVEKEPMEMDWTGEKLTGDEIMEDNFGGDEVMEDEIMEDETMEYESMEDESMNDDFTEDEED